VELVVCNDGSTDNSAAVLDALQQRIPCLKVVHHEKNRGYGAALRSAIAASTGDFVATVDSDGQFDIADIRAFLALITAQEQDAVVGYREHKSDTWMRVLANRVLTTMVRLLFGVGFRDSNCAVKVLRRDILDTLVLETCGFLFPTELCIKLCVRGARFIEKPVKHKARPAGSTKLRIGATAFQGIIFLVYLRLRTALYRAGVIEGI